MLNWARTPSAIGTEGLVERAVKSDQALAGEAPPGGHPGVVRSPSCIPEARTAVHQHAPAVVIDDAVNRLPPLHQPERNRAVREAEREVVGAVDGIEHP